MRLEKALYAHALALNRVTMPTRLGSLELSLTAESNNEERSCVSPLELEFNGSLNE